jgi:hypothetical protein
MTLSEDGKAKLDFIHRAAALAGVSVIQNGGFKKMPKTEFWKGSVKIRFLLFMVENQLEAWALTNDQPFRDVFTLSHKHLSLKETLSLWRGELLQAIEKEIITDFQAITYLTAVLQDPDTRTRST